MIRTMQSRLADLALVAILEYEAIPGLNSGKHLTRSLSVSSSSTSVNEAPDALQKQLTEFYNSCCLLGVDFAVLVQVFKQVQFCDYYFFIICCIRIMHVLLGLSSFTAVLLYLCYCPKQFVIAEGTLSLGERHANKI